MENSARQPYEWSNEKVLHFLELYFMETPIWNPHDIRHKDRNEVFDSWKRLEEALNFQFSVTELKKKRENLMSTYRKLQNKVRASRNLGEAFKPDWFAYETMARYLNDLYDNRSSKQCEEGEDPMVEYEESNLSEEDIKLDFEVAVNPEHVVANHLDQTSSNTGASTGRARKKRKAYVEENGLDDSSNGAQKRGPPLEEVSLFCELLGLKLRGLGDEARDAAMFEINNVMYHLKVQQAGGQALCGCSHLTPTHSFRGCQRHCGIGCASQSPLLKGTPTSSRQ